MDDGLLDKDLERRFPKRFAQDVAPYGPATQSASLVEKYSFNGEIISEKDLESIMKDSQGLLHKLGLYSICLKAAREFRELNTVTSGDAEEEGVRILFRAMEQSRPRLLNTRQKMLSKRRRWLETVGGHPDKIRELVQSELLNLEPSNCVIANDATCAICLDSIDEEDFAFACPNGHVFHLNCSVSYVTEALSGSVAPSTSLQCPMRCGCFFVFNGNEPPSPKLAEKAFKRIVVKKTNKRPRDCSDSCCDRPLKRQAPLKT